MLEEKKDKIRKGTNTDCLVLKYSLFSIVSSTPKFIQKEWEKANVTLAFPRYASIQK